MSAFLHINEVVKLPMLGNNDLLQRSRGRFLTWSKYVWEDMNLSTVKVAVREKFEINKRTNTIKLPCHATQLSSVNVIDKRTGILYPVFRNDKLHIDLVDIGAAKDCACEHKCSYKLCNTVKGYEAVTSVKSDFLPDGSPISFTCVDRKAVDSNGFLTEETQYPERIYTSGVWTTTIKHTETKKLCKLEVDDKGCICDTDVNIDACCTSCGIDGLIPFGGTADAPPCNEDSWIYYCDTKLDWFSTQCGYGRSRSCFNNIYNISEMGDTLIFPHDFGFDDVVVRFFSDVSLKDLYIPLIAVDAFIMGLKWWDAKYNDKKQDLAQQYSGIYARMKFGLLRELNKYRIEELRMITTPPVYVPGMVQGNRWSLDYNSI